MLFLVAGLMSACTKEMPEDTIIPTTAAQTSLETTEMLTFSSEEEMFKQIEVLKTMQEDELKTWYKQQNENFVSQFDFMWQIVEELDTANTLEEIKKIQSKYTGLMLFNDNEEDEDISPYIPSDYNGTELVCNKSGNVIIAGEVRNYNNLDSFEQTSAYKVYHQNIAREDPRDGIVGVFAENDKRKFWAEAYLNKITGTIELKLVAHKKRVLWNKYQTSYSIKMLEFNNWQERKSLAQAVLYAKPNYHETGDIKSGLFHPFVRGVSDKSIPATFAIRVFSRGVGEENAKDMKVEQIYR